MPAGYLARSEQLEQPQLADNALLLHNSSKNKPSAKIKVIDQHQNLNNYNDIHDHEESFNWWVWQFIMIFIVGCGLGCGQSRLIILESWQLWSMMMMMTRIMCHIDVAEQVQLEIQLAQLAYLAS